MSHIVVIGAGITGVTTAYALLERGCQVTVIERLRYPAMETSFANGGQLSASNAEVWNHWATVFKGMKWLLRSDAPLLLNPRPSWHKYSWLGEFVHGIGSYRRNTIETVKMAIAARDHLFRMAEREQIEFDRVSRGILHIYWNKHDFDRAGVVNRLLVEGGLDRRPVTPAEMREIEPTIMGNFYGGFFTPSDSTGDIHKFTTGLAKACERQGARFIFDAEVEDIVSADGVRISYRGTPLGGETERQDLVADGVVICAGTESRHLAAMVGDRVNVYPVKGYSITVHLDDEASRKAAPWVSLLDDSAKIVSSRLGDGRLRVAGTAEFNGLNRDIRYDRVKPLIDWTRALLPGVSTNRVISWAGLRPMTPDMMPRVCRGKRRGVYYNTGHGHLGWTLSAATAEMIADLISSDLDSRKVA